MEIVVKDIITSLFIYKSQIYTSSLDGNIYQTDIETKYISNEKVEFSLNKYFEDFRSIWQNSLTDRKITFEFRGDATDQCVIRAFEIDLDCIFNNLLSNALNALKGFSDIEKKISISCQNVNDNIEILFSDNGKGLDNKYKDNPEQIFDLFESSKVDQYGNVIGTGLGLSAVFGTIQEYYGAITVYSEVNVGSIFHIYFPLASNIAQEEKFLKEIKRGSGTILVIDDENNSKSLEALNTLIDEIMTYAKLEQGAPSLDLEKIIFVRQYSKIIKIIWLECAPLKRMTVLVLTNMNTIAL